MRALGLGEEMDSRDVQGNDQKTGAAGMEECQRIQRNQWLQSTVGMGKKN